MAAVDEPDAQQPAAASEAHDDASPTDHPTAPTIAITLTHHGQAHTLDLPAAATLADLAAAIAARLSVPEPNQKLLVPRVGLLRGPYDAARRAQPLAAPGPLSLPGKRLTLMGTTAGELASLSSARDAAAAREAHLASARREQARLLQKNSKPPSSSSAARGGGGGGGDAAYTFRALRALPHLPQPERSHAFLERLRDDPGIRAAMRAHRFTVGLLTEMDPLANTSASHEGVSRILGLNRNMGQVIELRLRTDAYDGWRDYRTIRRTLCHELAHNVRGPHDRQFWDLCHAIEREVDRGDWRSGGRAVGGDADYYEPLGEGVADEGFDHGGWTGGEFVLGGRGGGAGGGGGGVGAAASGLSRREMMAKAAEERMKKTNPARDPGPGPGSGSDGSSAT